MPDHLPYRVPWTKMDATSTWAERGSVLAIRLASSQELTSYRFTGILSQAAISGCEDRMKSNWSILWIHAGWHKSCTAVRNEQDYSMTQNESYMKLSARWPAHVHGHLLVLNEAFVYLASSHCVAWQNNMCVWAWIKWWNSTWEWCLHIVMLTSMTVSSSPTALKVAPLKIMVSSSLIFCFFKQCSYFCAYDCINLSICTEVLVKLLQEQILFRSVLSSRYLSAYTYKDHDRIITRDRI